MAAPSQEQGECRWWAAAAAAAAAAGVDRALSVWYRQRCCISLDLAIPLISTIVIFAFGGGGRRRRRRSSSSSSIAVR